MRLSSCLIAVLIAFAVGMAVGHELTTRAVVVPLIDSITYDRLASGHAIAPTWVRACGEVAE